MQDLKMLETWEKQSKRTNISGKRTIDDLQRIEARDIPDDGTLPNGKTVVFGAYRHRALPTSVETVRWMVQCPLCRRPCRVLYDLDGHFMCHGCTGLPYRSAISGRSQRAVVAITTHPEKYQEIQARLQRDCLHDADMSNARYHAKRKERAAARLRKSQSRDGYELPDVESFTDA